MPYRRIISTLGCTELGLDGVAALVRRHGLAGAELRGLGGELDLPAHFAATLGAPAAFGPRLRELGLDVVALNTSAKLAGGTAAERDHLLAHVPWAEAAGVRWLRVFDGGRAGDAATRAEAAAFLAWWREERRRAGWQCDLLVETHDALVDAAAITGFAAEVGGFAVLWDSHHTWAKGGEDPVATWDAIRPHVVHVHVKDSISRPSARHPFTFVLPGAGEFPMAPLRARLAAEFAGPVSLEWERRWHPSLPPLDEALAAAAGGWW